MYVPVTRLPNGFYILLCALLWIQQIVKTYCPLQVKAENIDSLIETASILQDKDAFALDIIHTEGILNYIYHHLLNTFYLMNIYCMIAWWLIDWLERQLAFT